MLKEDVYTLRTIVNEYGVRDSVSGLIQALREYADEMSDRGLKEKAIQAANMADVLQDINGDSN